MKNVSASNRSTGYVIGGVGIRGPGISATNKPKIMLIIGQSNVQGVDSLDGTEPPYLEGTLWKGGSKTTVWPDPPGPCIGVATHQLRWVYEHGVSGTSIGQWISSTMNAVKTNLDSIGLTPDVVLWDQGNKDAIDLSTADIHEDRLGTLDGLWQGYWPGIPSIITKTTGLSHSNYPYRDIVRAAIDAHAATVADAIIAGTRPATATCTVLDWGIYDATGTVDGIHRTLGSQILAGEDALAAAISLGIMV